MKVGLGKGQAEQDRSALLVVLATAGKNLPKEWPAEFHKLLAEPLKSADFEGKAKQTTLAYRGARRRLVAIGLGDAGKLCPDVLRRAGAAAAAQARAAKVERLAVLVPRLGKMDVAEGLRAVTEGLVLGAYDFRGVKTEKDEGHKALRAATVYGNADLGSGATAAVRAGQIGAEAQCLARDLGNQPGNVATPRYLAQQARKIARSAGLRCKVLSQAELERRKFGGLLGVAKGSEEPPAFIEMEYRPRQYKKTVCLIGKGVSFDSGGISIKPANGMEEMKFDMCGGAAVLGAMHAIGTLKPKVRVHALVPAAENMPGGRALKPGDVLTIYGGLTVEVNNTDAEGRLVLADALGRAQELKPDYTVDLATLTGACVMALGHRASGLFSQASKLSKLLQEAGEQSHERLWPLPLWEEFLDDMKSMVADVKNTGPRWGGAATAAAFLRKFAGDLTWAHLDIAGTAWDTPKNEYYRGGATGVGVRLLLRFVEALA